MRSRWLTSTVFQNGGDQWNGAECDVVWGRRLSGAQGRTAQMSKGRQARASSHSRAIAWHTQLLSSRIESTEAAKFSSPVSPPNSFVDDPLARHRPAARLDPTRPNDVVDAGCDAAKCCNSPGAHHFRWALRSTVQCKAKEEESCCRRDRAIDTDSVLARRSCLRFGTDY